MIFEMFSKGFEAVIESFVAFQGTGLIVTLFLASLLFICYGTKDRFIKDIFVKYSIYVLILFFLPIWYVYIYFKSDYEILYRILWLLPIGIVVCYTLVEVIYKFSEKIRSLSFVGALLLIVICGEYVYSSEFFSRAENEYHVPDIVVDICKEVEVEGKEIRIAVPDELVSYVRQYSSTVLMPYGRETLMGLNPGLSYLQSLLSEDVINTPEMVHELRDWWTPYLVIRSDARFTESLADYDLVYVTSFGDYDMYLDSETNIGLDYINKTN